MANSNTVRFNFVDEDFSFINEEMKYELEKGKFTITLGGLQDEINIS